MANFTPHGKIRIGRVPFDNSYRHTLTFSNINEQTSYFASICEQSLEKDNYTYIRMNNAIRVPFNAERLYTYNYVMYQNADYGTKWFYAFIVSVNYVNENMTELVLQLDVMQTWYFDYELKSCFVEREHVNDDTVGAHLNAEPGMDLQYVYNDFQDYVYHFGDCFIVLMTNAYPAYTTPNLAPEPDNYDNIVTMVALSGSNPTSGSIYQGQINACKPILYRTSNEYSLERFKADIKGFNKCGAGETICDAYIVPANCIDPNSIKPYEYRTQQGEIAKTGIIVNQDVPIVTAWEFVDNAQAQNNWRSIYRPSQIGNNKEYKPRNNKLLCYPYAYLELGDFSGRKQDYQWEYFELDSQGRVEMWERKAATSDCQGYVVPSNYNGIVTINGQTDAKSAQPFTFEFSNKISWVYSAYQNWLAQNSVINALTVLGSIGAIATGMASGITAASAIAGVGSMPVVSGMRASAGVPLLEEYNQRRANADIARNSLGQSKAAIAGGLGGLGSVIGNVEKMKRVPNTAKGNISSNSKLQNGFCGWYMAQVSIRTEFARIIDDFFDCYGYSIERHKIPNREGRPFWNYVKTQNADHYGNVPSEDMAFINKIYDSGITFWHPYRVNNIWYAPVGDYSKDNRAALR